MESPQRKGLPRGVPAGRIGVVSSYAPSRCGIARFASSLINALGRVAPSLDVEVVRLVDGLERGDMPLPMVPVGMEYDPDCPLSVRTAARHLDRGDLAIIQHEYGLYGSDDGRSVLDLIAEVHVPVISILHTVLRDPSERQRTIIERLSQAGRLVALSQSARQVLLTHYAVDPSNVIVVPHGSAWAAAPPNRGPRRRLISWGLIGPGKGLERSIDAIAALRPLLPDIEYKIVGQTHPKVLRRHGQQYRQRLEQRVSDLDIGGNVQFVDRYVGDAELYDLVCDSDVVLAPYDNSVQICSGVLAEAIAAGRPVVATRFPHAIELLGSGAGLVVGHDDPTDMASAVRQLLVDDKAYDNAASIARGLSPGLSWDAVAATFAELFANSLTLDRITA